MGKSFLDRLNTLLGVPDEEVPKGEKPVRTEKPSETYSTVKCLEHLGLTSHDLAEIRHKKKHGSAPSDQRSDSPAKTEQNRNHHNESSNKGHLSKKSLYELIKEIRRVANNDLTIISNLSELIELAAWAKNKLK